MIDERRATFDRLLGKLMQADIIYGNTRGPLVPLHIVEQILGVELLTERRQDPATFTLRSLRIGGYDVPIRIQVPRGDPSRHADELIVYLRGFYDRYVEPGQELEHPATVFIAVHPAVAAELHHRLTPELEKVLQVPRTCRVCGCNEQEACEDGCHWVTADVCSQCVDTARSRSIAH